jgi:hypothetical protein
VYWLPDTLPLRFPFKSEIDRLYKWKQNETDPILKLYVKIILNSIYGKNIQKTPNLETSKYDTGNMFNPFYASYITANTRLQIFTELLKTDIDTLIMVATDSIMVTKPLDVPISESLGDWGLESTGKAVVLGSGVYSVETDDSKVITKKRGFRTLKGLNFCDPETYQTVDKSILIPVKNHFTLAKALISKDFDKMNLIEQDTRTLNINFDYRRYWQKQFDSVCDILNTFIDSEPVLIDFL